MSNASGESLQHLEEENTMENSESSGTSEKSDLLEFKHDFERKQEERRQILAEKRKEIGELRSDLERYKVENEELRKTSISAAQIDKIIELDARNVFLKSENKELKLGMEYLKSENKELKLSLKSVEEYKQENINLTFENENMKMRVANLQEVEDCNQKLRIKIAEIQSDLQKLNSEFVSFEQERLEYTKHVSALKDVIRATKEMLVIRETQIEDLKAKITTIEELLASKEMKFMSDGLREEYERQIKNIRNLRALYDERQRLDKKDKDQLKSQLEETKKLLEDEQKKDGENKERIRELEEDNSKKYDSIISLESTLGLSKAGCVELQAQIDIINQLFSEILLGFSSYQEIDLDKLISTLEENHGLLKDMVTNEESSSIAAALPKLLLELINQFNNESKTEISKNENPEQLCTTLHQLHSAKEIVENLPKVWKVLIELLSHQIPPTNNVNAESDKICYKSVESPTGPKLKLSVSQTFIRLKDLILEKKFLERELFRLKHLNTHLDTRLQDQEKRLELVSGEVKKTWNIVGKMQKQHQQLHTHEKVLRHELKEKRNILTQLKEELEYCREKWAMAREKNNSTQEQWKELRKEFASRKIPTTEEYNQSAESGYSDDKDSSEDEKGYESDVSEAKAEHLEENLLDTIKEDGDISETEDKKENPENNLLHTILEDDDTSKTEEKIQNSEKTLLDTIRENDDSFKTEENKRHDNDVPGTDSLKQKEDLEKTSNISSTDRKIGSSCVDITNLKLKDKLENENSSSSEEATPGTSNDCEMSVLSREIRETLMSREERLSRLENECKALVQNTTRTCEKSVTISNKLDSLHNTYGESKDDKEKDTKDKEEE